jgi:glycosyltransferase involved in cell wall biosynthesis
MKMESFTPVSANNRNRRLRIAMIIQNYHPAIGGAEKQLKSLVPFLINENCDLHILTRLRPGLAPLEKMDGVLVHRIPAPGPKAVASLSFTFRALLELKRLRPDVIHAHELLSPTTTAVAAKQMMGTPVVAKVLGGGCLGDLAKLKQKNGGTRRIQIYRKYVDTFIAVSTQIDRELDAAGIPPEKRCSIPNGVDTDRFVPAADMSIKNKRRNELQLPGEPIVVYTGRFAPEKRLDDLIRLWPAVQRNHPGAALYLIGTGEEEQKLRSMQRTGIKVIGPVDDVVPYLQAADLFVLPSEREGLSNSMLEAMSCGLPVVATNVGGAMDLLIHLENGFLVPVDDFRNFEQMLVAVLGNPDLRKKAANSARIRIVQRYSLQQTAEELRALYDSVLDLPAGRVQHPLQVSA